MRRWAHLRIPSLSWIPKGERTGDPLPAAVTAGIRSEQITPTRTLFTHVFTH